MTSHAGYVVLVPTGLAKLVRLEGAKRPSLACVNAPERPGNGAGGERPLLDNWRCGFSPGDYPRHGLAGNGRVSGEVTGAEPSGSAAPIAAMREACALSPRQKGFAGSQKPAGHVTSRK